MVPRTMYQLADAGRSRKPPAVRRYLKQVQRKLLCSRSQKKPFLAQLEDTLLLFCEETGDAGWNALVARFGAPENMAHEFMAGLGLEAVWEYQRRSIHWMFAVISITAALIFAMSAHTYVERLAFMNGYWVETITIGPDIPTNPDHPPLWTVTSPAGES